MLFLHGLNRVLSLFTLDKQKGKKGERELEVVQETAVLASMTLPFRAYFTQEKREFGEWEQRSVV